MVLGGIERPDGTRVPAKICLLAGADREYTSHSLTIHGSSSSMNILY